MTFDHRRVALGALLFFGWALAAAAPHPTCVPSPEVAAILERSGNGGSEEVAAAMLEELATRPLDIHLNRTYQQVTDPKKTVDRYRELAEAHKDDPAAVYLYGRLLGLLEDPKAEQPLLATLELDPDYPWAHFALARLYENVIPDAAKAQAHLAASIDQCPNSEYILRRLGDLPRPEVARRAAAVRARLAETVDTTQLPLIQAVWAAEFRASPPSEHDAVRERVRADLRTLRGEGEVEDLQLLHALLEGYGLVGDEWDVQATIASLAHKFPEDGTAKQFEYSRFGEKREAPQGCPTSAESRAFYRDLAEASRRWVELWPNDRGPRRARLEGLVGSGQASAEALSAAIDAFLETKASRSSRDEESAALEAAEMLVRNGQAHDRVPALIERGMAEVRALDPAISGAARDAERRTEHRKLLAQGLATLTSAQLQRGEVDAARLTFAELERVLPEDPHQPKLDPEHLALYRRDNAIGDVLRQGPVPCDASTAKAARAALLERFAPELAALEAMNPERETELPPQFARFKPVSLELPDFELQDATGHIWRTSDLRGKVVLIHAWMDVPPITEMLAWCQELGRRLDGRSDVVVLTFNVDDNPGKIESKMASRGYTFPVMFAKDYLAKQGRKSLPFTWVMDRGGVVRFEDSGFGFDRDGWLTDALKAIDEVAQGAPPTPAAGSPTGG